MTIHGTGTPIYISEINNELKGGTALGGYRGTQWFIENGSSGNFSGGTISMSEFYNKKKLTTTTGSIQVDSSVDWVFHEYDNITIEYWGGGGGAGAGYGAISAGGHYESQKVGCEDTSDTDSNGSVVCYPIYENRWVPDPASPGGNGQDGSDSYIDGLAPRAGGGKGGLSDGGYQTIARSGAGGTASGGNQENTDGGGTADYQLHARGGDSPNGGTGGARSPYWPNNRTAGDGNFPGGGGGSGVYDAGNTYYAWGGSGGGGAYVKSTWAKGDAGAPVPGRPYYLTVGKAGARGASSQGTLSGSGASGLIRISWTGSREVSSTGGDISYDGAYKFHTFRGSGRFTVSGPVVADILIVGGGGAGGYGGTYSAPYYFDNQSAGGGGAGAVWQSTLTLWPGHSYNCEIGGGGGTSNSSEAASGDGGRSSFGIFDEPAPDYFKIEVFGGGGGGGAYPFTFGHRYADFGPEHRVGSGGGGASCVQDGALWGNGGPPDWGNYGGRGGNTGTGGGGGGGANHVGYDGDSVAQTGSCGGAGLDAWGHQYAGGGGGAVAFGEGPGTGSYGGGNGSYQGTRNATNGASNSGSGGGGGAQGNNGAAGGGGSGVIVIRFRYRA